jgi:uncharacterized damage-inducible protein DinB
MLAYTRDYIRKALAGTPDVLEHLLSGLAPDDPLWDNRPEANRWTLREVTAHLAAWDEIFAERIELTRTLSEPEFGHVDVDEQATQLKFALSNPQENLRLFRERRAALIDFLDSLEDEEWERLCRRHFGTMSIAEQIALILAHDNYHLQQVAEWLSYEPVIHL